MSPAPRYMTPPAHARRATRFSSEPAVHFNNSAIFAMPSGLFTVHLPGAISPFTAFSANALHPGSRTPRNWPAAASPTPLRSADLPRRRASCRRWRERWRAITPIPPIRAAAIRNSISHEPEESLLEGFRASRLRDMHTQRLSGSCRPVDESKMTALNRFLQPGIWQSSGLFPWPSACSLIRPMKFDWRRTLLSPCLRRRAAGAAVCLRRPRIRPQRRHC